MLMKMRGRLKPNGYGFIGVFLSLLLLTFQVHAADFKEGETVFVGFPAADIGSDAFIIGTVVKVMSDGDYRISVSEYVHGHDYGLSCVPMLKEESVHGQESSLGNGWKAWTDTTNLDSSDLDYVVKAKDVMKLDYGKHYFIERYNLAIAFGRWESDAPMMTVDRLENAKREAKAIGLEALWPALDVAILDRQSFYGENSRPYYAFETIAPLNKLLSHIEALFKQEPQLYSLWKQKQRNWKAINESMRNLFLIHAIDKAIADAGNQLYEEGIERAGKDEIAALKAHLANLQRDK
ncbi:hypothetical protein [Thiomicrorhabdus heinhorstiae]|uniref:Uncharacterized protein n=1 Tax=Thiomicrorhabdus heinhorstiae TaxID=2748010 RepID=A0ABS0BSJ2_9GAMM|nr:hypothetical protein [Thiomicrorhabdus heinhorstiae]MBF6056832.1 hypothetical protein [Thiomicrorhabdus heinhorstiae]